MTEDAQYRMDEDATYDVETGEIKEPVLSREAMKGVRRPNLWARRENASNALQVGDEFAYAYLGLQSEIKPVIATDKENPFLKKDNKASTTGDYTSLAHLLRIVRPIMNRWFFTFEQYTGDIFGLTDTPGNKHLFLPVFTRLEHVPTMQHKIYRLPMPIVKFDCQAVGSAFSYGKRYSLMGALGIASGTEDDDGNSASVVKGLDGKLSELAQSLSDKMRSFKTLRELKQWASDNAAGFDILEESDRDKLRVLYGDLTNELSGDQAPAAKGKK